MELDENRMLFSATALIIAAILVYTHSGPLPLSYDFGGHLSRIYVLLNDGFGWTDMWYNGHALLKFYPPLYHFLFAAVGAVSFDLIRPFSFGILGVAAFGSMYYYTVRKLDSYRAAASGVFFLSGWMLYIAHVSGSMPQAFAAALAPAFYAEIENSLEGSNPAFAGVLGAAIVLFHHNAAIAIAAGAVLLIGLHRQKNVLNALSAGVLTVLLSGFWLFPALLSYGDTTYSLLNSIATRGLEDVIFVVPVFGAPILVKLIAGVSTVREHSEHAILASVFLILSLGYSAVVVSHIPVISHLPPYRFYIVTSFAVSFLAAVSERKVLVPALLLVAMFSVTGMGYVDDAGFRPGQKQAYQYIQDQDVDLLYDSEDTDIRAYALTVHGKDIADGWSVGSTAVRPGLMRFADWQRTGNSSAVDFLERWSVTHVITYRNTEQNRNLHQMVNSSEIYSLDSCFEQVCIFEAGNLESPVMESSGDIYVVNASRTLPIPYSSNFNVSTKPTEEGFTKLDGEGRRVMEYENSLSNMFSAGISGIAVIIALIIYVGGFSIGRVRFKSFR